MKNFYPIMVDLHGRCVVCNRRRKSCRTQGEGVAGSGGKHYGYSAVSGKAGIGKKLFLSY
jgi:hypothetical protein